MGRKKGILYFLLCLAVIGVGVNALPIFLTPPGSLKVTLEDPVFSTDLAGRDMSLMYSDGKFSLKGVISRENGAYACLFTGVKAGQQALSVKMADFDQTPSMTVDVPSLGLADLNVSLTPDFGRLLVKAFDARSRDRVLNEAEISIKDREATFLALENGFRQVDLKAGDYVVRLNAAGYCDQERQADIRKGRVTELAAPLSPELDPDRERMRILLDWGPDPRDLDSHLLMQSHSEIKGKGWVYFANKRVSLKNGKLLAMLDVDNTNSEGVETITVFTPLTYTTHYAVHLFAGRGSIGISDATVEVISAGCRKETFRPPAGCSGRVWHVFDLSPDMRIIPKNVCMESFPKDWQIKAAKKDEDEDRGAVPSSGPTGPSGTP